MLVAVVGPTAAGKSALALALARRLGGEIINADAFSLYRGMDIGTAKPTCAERLLVPHHQLDVLDLTDDASVAAYQGAARADASTIRDRGRLPLLVGGSGLYVRSVVDDLRFPGTDPAIRSRLEAEAAELPSGALHGRLARLDPVAAAGILPSNTRRLVRALEVIELTGQPFSATMPSTTPRADLIQLGVDLNSAALDERIGLRVARMLEQGFLAEVSTLAEQGLASTRTASRAIGYAQLLDHLAGRRTLREASDATVLATRQLVRRQRKWFRRDPRIVWLDGASPTLLDDALSAIDVPPQAL